MSSVYERDGFEMRVNFAAAVIASGRATTRSFDSCFETWDGEHVIEAIRRRAEHNPKIAARFPKYIVQASIDEQRERFQHLTRNQLAAAARDYARTMQDEWEARHAKHIQEPASSVAA